MHIGIIDCDLLAKGNHRFPNLACMKISSYYKNNDHDVDLVRSWEEDLSIYDKLLVSKVFTSTEIPVIKHDNIRYGGTGFYFDKAEPLPDRIEHIKPDYTLYYDYIKQFPYSKKLRKSFEAYIDYSIGFLTRGCFRKCKFCVNQNYDMVREHSPLKEFYDENRKVICMLDDNFFGFANWKSKIIELQETDKKFFFKQGLDIRILTDEKCSYLFNSKYYRDYIFAFDSMKDYDLIHEKLKLIRKYSISRNIKFYVLVGFEGTDENDIENAFKRIELLMRYQCLPYIMRYQSKNEVPWKNSKCKGMYVTLARWCNQPSFFKKMSFRRFCEYNQEYSDNKGRKGLCSSMRALVDFEKEYPEIAKKYFDVEFESWK